MLGRMWQAATNAVSNGAQWIWTYEDARKRVLESPVVEGFGNLLLPDGLIAPGVLKQRDGSYLAAWQYTGPDLGFAGEARLEANTQRMSNMLRLGSGWMIQADEFRVHDPDYVPSGEFTHPVPELFDRVRAEKFRTLGAQYRSEFFLSITYKPSRKNRRPAWLTTEGKDETRDERDLRRFQNGIEAFERILGTLFNIRRLGPNEDGTDDLLRYLHRCITGIDRPVRTPELPLALNHYLADQDCATGTEPRIGPAGTGMEIGTISLENYPITTEPGMLDELNHLQMEYRWHTRVILLDPWEAVEMMETHRKAWQSAMIPFRDRMWKNPAPVLNLDAVDMAAEVQRAMKEATAADVYYAAYNSVFVVMNPDRAAVRETALEIQRVVQNKGFGTRIEDVNCMESFLGTIPGESRADVRRVHVNTLNIACLAPVTAVWPGRKENPSQYMRGASCLLQAVTTGATAFHANLHVDKSGVGHTLICGTTGGGKSTLLQTLMLSWMRYEGARVFHFDYQHSAEIACHAVGGTHYDLGGGGIGFCPLKHLDTSEDMTWAKDWVEQLCILSGLKITPDHRNAISDALSILRELGHRTLTDLYAKVGNVEVRTALKFYTESGEAGSLLDAEEDLLDGRDFQESRFIVFETASLLDTNADRVALPVLSYIFRRIDKSLQGDPTFIGADEGWKYLQKPIFERHITKWTKTLRRNNGVFVLATQQLSDVMKSPIADVLIQNCPTKIFTPDSNALAAGSPERYARFGLSLEKVRALSTAVVPRDYLWHSTEGSRMIDLALGPVELAIVGVTSPEERAYVKKHFIEKYGPTWTVPWLREFAKHTRNREHSMAILGWADYLEQQFEAQKEQKGGNKLCVISA